MMGLWADGWFYISSAGFLISGVLFFFLLGQYRAASEAADAGEERAVEKESDAAARAAIRPVYVPDEAPAAKIASHPAAEAAEAKPEPAPAKVEGAGYAGPERRKDGASTTGGISPAVVYLQNIKGELTELHQELRTLAKRVDSELGAVSARDEALIERLGELARAVEGLKSAAPAVAAPAPEPEPAVAALAPEPEPEPEPAAPEPAVSEPIELSSAPPEPAPASAEAAPEAPSPQEKPRRGPVWPV